jgi:hypothetical protein
MAKSRKPLPQQPETDNYGGGGTTGSSAGAKGAIPWAKGQGPSGAANHVRTSFQDEAHAPRRKTLDKLKIPSYCLGDLCAADVKEYLKYSDTILVPKASLEQHGAHLRCSVTRFQARRWPVAPGRRAASCTPPHSGSGTARST